MQPAQDCPQDPGIYDDQGFWFAHKRLSAGRFRHWPERSHLDAHELQALIWNFKVPPKRCTPINPLVQRKKPDPPCLDQTPIELNFSRMPEPVILQVRRLPEEKLFNALIEHFHYLGYRQPVGEHLKHLVFIDERPVACFSWSSAPRHLGPRDRFIGWPPEVRRKNLHLIAYNSRFLILPWVRIPSLASHLLSLMARSFARDWENLYGHPIVLLETFVDSERFLGTCYRAANWIHVDQTTGRGKDDLTHTPKVINL